MHGTKNINREPSLSMYRLGYLGLIPFVALSAISIYEFYYFQDEAKKALELYSFGIFAFLCGTLWPRRCVDTQGYKSLVSNILFLTAFFSFVALPDHFLFISGCLFIVLYLVETRLLELENLNDAYRKLRRNLTVVASVSVVLTALNCT